MSKLRNEKNGNRSFFSLKAKWSIGTGIGVLVIFAVFSVMLFQSFSSLLMNQEKQYAEDSLRTAIGKLADNEGELTKQDVVKSLSLKITPSDNQNLYTNSVYTSLTRENIGISVYNLSGDLVFASRNVPVKFSSGSYQESRLAKDKNGRSIYVLSHSVYSKTTHQTIGYVQVTNSLISYDRTRQRLVIIFLVFGLTAAFALALLAMDFHLGFCGQSMTFMTLSEKLPKVMKARHWPTSEFPNITTKMSSLNWAKCSMACLIEWRGTLNSSNNLLKTFLMN